MFSVTLGSTGYQWTCAIGLCRKGGNKPNAAEAASAAIRHRDEEHPEAVWSETRHQAARQVMDWLTDLEVADGLTVAPASIMALVNSIAATLGAPAPRGDLTPIVDAVANWGKDPLTMDNMHDIRLIEAPAPPDTTRNWTTNHMVRWSVGEAIQHPPEGSGCQCTGARVGENVEVCALPKHNAVNIKHVFAIGGRVTRIAHN